METLIKGRYRARRAETPQDLHAVQALRGRCFRGEGAGPDADGFDAICTHVLVEELPEARLVCCFRLLPLASGAEIGRSYSAQFYDLSALHARPGALLELGRFCMAPERHDPDILRLAWAAITRLVDAAGVELLFGCSSFPGTDWERFHDAFALLARGHLAPPALAPRPRAPRVVLYAARLAGEAANEKHALASLPPLLRSYLAMGGWVSDHAVIDDELGTLHVFTGLEIAAIPAARARALRQLAG